jgi:hypothetical protein
MNRGAYRSPDASEQTSDMASAKETGSIEYSARVMLSLRSVKGEPDLAEVRLAKNKHGPSWRGPEDSVYLRLDRLHMRLEQTVAPSTTPEELAAVEAEKEAKASRNASHDAKKLATALAGYSDLGTVKLRELVKQKLGWGIERLGAARVALEQGVGGHRLEDRGTTNRPKWFLVREPVPTEGD